MGVVRDHIPDNSEIQALITAEYEEKSRISTPIQAIVKFIIFYWGSSRRSITC